ncbi:MAG: MFS transporter [Rhodothermales bacterium]
MTTSNEGINHQKLFWGSCLSLITTAFAFSVTREIQTDIQVEFLLSNANLGLFGGVFFWGFVLSQVIFSPLCDTIGIRPIVRGAFVGHVSGALLMMFASNFTMLWVGSLLTGVGAGLVEAGCNPLIVALYPKTKTHKLNMFHMWFPYGNVIAALLALGLSAMDVAWETRLMLILIPAVIYGVMMFTAKYPQTEGVAAGVSTGDMLKACFTSPLMLMMLVMMLITASMELPPSSWVPPYLESSGTIPGILVFAFVFGIMGTLRLLAGPVERVLRPTGILFGGAVLATIGLYAFSQAESTFMLFFTAAIWAAGIAYFWPTMLGYVSENNPKSGALGLGMMGAMGMMAAAFVTPYVGTVSDELGHDRIPATETVSILNEVSRTLPTLSATGDDAAAINEAVTMANQALSEMQNGALPAVTTTQALRAIDKVKSLPAVASSSASSAANSVSEIIHAADTYGQRSALKGLSLFGIILIVVFGALLLRDRARGGYKAEDLLSEHAEEATSY